MSNRNNRYDTFKPKKKNLPRNFENTFNLETKIKKEKKKREGEIHSFSKRFIMIFLPRKARRYTHAHTYIRIRGRIQLDLFQVKDRTDRRDRCWWHKRGEIPRRKEKQQKGSSKFGELGENRWPSAPMGGLAFRTRNSPSQKTSLRWGDCCPPNPNPPSSSAVWKDRHQDMPPVPV